MMGMTEPTMKTYQDLRDEVAGLLDDGWFGLGTEEQDLRVVQLVWRWYIRGVLTSPLRRESWCRRLRSRWRVSPIYTNGPR